MTGRCYSRDCVRLTGRRRIRFKSPDYNTPIATPMTLDNSQLRRLRGLCHKLDPVVMVADKGLTDNVRHEIESALEAHELIKVRLRAGRDQRRAWIDEIATATGADLVQRIGQVACFYRRHPDRPAVAP